MQRAAIPACLMVLSTGVGTLYEFSMAAVTSCRNLNGLKQLGLLFYSFRGPKSEMGLIEAEIKVSVGLVTFGGSR